MVKRVQRLRGRRAVARRDRWLYDHPLCVRCYAAGLLRPTAEVDHIVPLSKGGADDELNLQSLCTECHAEKTREDFGHAPSSACDANGWPLSARHSWNRQD